MPAKDTFWAPYRDARCSSRREPDDDGSVRPSQVELREYVKVDNSVVELVGGEFQQQTARALPKVSVGLLDGNPYCFVEKRFVNKFSWTYVSSTRQ